MIELYPIRGCRECKQHYIYDDEAGVCYVFRQVDIGKFMALLTAGWDTEKLAAEYGLSIPEIKDLKTNILSYLRRKKKKNK